MGASYYCHHEVVRTLLEGGVDVNAQDKVRNQMLMMMIVIVLTIMMVMMRMTMMIIIVVLTMFVIDDYDNSK